MPCMNMLSKYLFSSIFIWDLELNDTVKEKEGRILVLFYTEIGRSVAALLRSHFLHFSPKVCMSFIIFWFLTDFSFGIFIF